MVHEVKDKVKVDDALFEEICSRVSSGETLLEVSRDLNFQRADFYRYRNSNPQRVDTYARARIDQAECWADDIVEISDDSSQDKIFDMEGNARQNSEFIQRSKLRTENRKWLMARLHNSQWGEKLEQTHKGIPPAQSATLVLLPMQERIKAMRERRESQALGSGTGDSGSGESGN